MLKKIISVCFSFALLSSPLISFAITEPSLPDDYGDGSAPGVYCPQLSSTFQKGARDSTTNGQVSELQSFLTDYYNLPDGALVGGYFGKMTQQYAVQFQTEQGLPAFGIIGMLTRAKIASVCGDASKPPPPPPTAPITVTAPNGGERWEEGILNSITWSPYNYNPDINPSRDVDAFLERYDCKGEPNAATLSDNCFTNLGSVLPGGKASIHWMTGALQNGGPDVPPGQYFIRVVNRQTGAWDRSDRPFTITPKQIDLKVNGSDGPVTINSVNQSVNLSWRASPKMSNCTISGVINADGSNVTSVANSGTMQVVPNLYGNSQTNMYLSCTPAPINDNDPSPIQWYSSAYDTVSIMLSGEPQPAASLSVVSPNGGEQIDPTQSMGIRFSPSGLSSVAVALYKNDQWKYWITKNFIPSGKTVDRVDFTPSQALQDLGVGDNAGAIWKIYVTGQKTDGSGYVDDKSDSPFSFIGGVTSTPVCPPPTILSANGQCVPLSSPVVLISTSANSPSGPTQVNAGATGVVIGVYKFRVTGENISLMQVGLKLTSGKPQDVTQVYLYDVNSNLIGSSVFAGSSVSSIALANPMIIGKDTDVTLTVKADIAQVGTNQPGTAGDVIKIDSDSARGTGLTSGLSITTIGSTAVGGVMIAGPISPVCAPPATLVNGQCVTPTLTPAPTCSIGPSAKQITLGQSVTFTWTSTNATSASFNGGAASVNSSQTITPNNIGTFPYVITVTGAGGQTTCSTNVTVTAPTPPPPPAALSCTTPVGATIASGSSISSNGQQFKVASAGSMAYAQPLMRCSNGSWLKCDYQGNSCVPYVPYEAPAQCGTDPYSGLPIYDCTGASAPLKKLQLANALTSLQSVLEQLVNTLGQQ